VRPPKRGQPGPAACGLDEGLLLGRLALTAVALREQLVSPVDHEILDARDKGVVELAEVPDRRGDALGPLADGLGD
jgi:hypothetical protein